ncbi:MAG: transcription antitermination factor NusB [Alphaproteobacteria bacterium]|nr:transcription antitermination factor NusB [Alphaproteobacteria bacterium]
MVEAKDQAADQDGEIQPVDPRSLARLYAVQALYQIELSDQSADHVIADFKDRGFSVGDGDVSGEPDTDLFTTLVVTASSERPRLDALIDKELSTGRSSGNLEALLGIILRCGAGELLAGRNIPASVTINEYVDIAHAFYGGREPALVNGLLDTIAKALQAKGGISE